MLLLKTESELEILEADRPIVNHLRTFLSRLSMKFYNLIKSALNETYHETDSVFFRDDLENESSIRLRARIHKHNGRFAAYMRQHAEKRRVTDNQDSEMNKSNDSDNSDEIARNQQLSVTRKELMEWVEKVYFVPKIVSNKAE